MSTGDKSFSSSGGSTGSAGGSTGSGGSTGHGVVQVEQKKIVETEEPTYTVEQLAKKLPLDKHVVQWLQERPYDPNDPVLVLIFENAFHELVTNPVMTSEQKIQALAQGLEENGAVPKSDHAYFFRTWPELNNARLQMKETHAWAYTPSEQYLRYINQAPQPMKIKCFVIHSMTKNDANIFEYPFFEF